MGRASAPILTVVTIAAVVVAAPVVGAAIASSMGATLGATGTAALGAAAISGTSAAVNSAIQGGNINDVLKAGAIGAAGGAVGGAVGAQVPAGDAIGRGIASGATGSATSAAIRGQDPVRAGIIGGAAGGVTAGVTQAITPSAPSGQAPGAEFDYAGGDRPVFDPVTGQELTPQQVAAQNPQLYPGGILPAMGQETVYSPTGEVTYQAATPIPQRPGSEERAIGSIAGRETGRLLSDLFYPTGATALPSGGYSYGVGDVTTGAGSPTFGAGSSALGQALRIGDPGAPIESPGGGETTSRPVWNIASLRVKDETGG